MSNIFADYRVRRPKAVSPGIFFHLAMAMSALIASKQTHQLLITVPLRTEGKGGRSAGRAEAIRAAGEAAAYFVFTIMGSLRPDGLNKGSPVRFRHRHAAVMRGRLSKAMSQPLPIRARRGTAKRRESEDLQASAFAGRCLRLRMKVGEAYPFLPAVCEKQAAGFLMEEIPAERRF